jgi:ribonuclease HI
MHLKIYTDGGCSGNPGPGGWAYAITEDKSGRSVVIAEKWGAEKDATNNRMELRAVIAALEALPVLKLVPEKVTVFTDSQYVQKGMSLWIHSWKQKNWRTSSREPVKNKELWLRLDELAAGLAISWEWVRGHAGNPFNERCDYLTRRAMASLK